MTETEEQIMAEVRKKLPMEVRFAVDDPTRFRMTLQGPVMTIETVPGFLFDRLKRGDIQNIFLDAARKWNGTTGAIIMEELKQKQDQNLLTELNLKFNFPEQPTGKVNYHDWMNSDGWRKKRNKKLKEAGYKCELCGSAKNLRVHHITYENLGHEPMDDLLAVCDNCHKKLHKEDLIKKGGH